VLQLRHVHARPRETRQLLPKGPCPRDPPRMTRWLLTTPERHPETAVDGVGGGAISTSVDGVTSVRGTADGESAKLSRRQLAVEQHTTSDMHILEGAHTPEAAVCWRHVVCPQSRQPQGRPKLAAPPLQARRTGHADESRETTALWPRRRFRMAQKENIW